MPNNVSKNIINQRSTYSGPLKLEFHLLGTPSDDTPFMLHVELDDHHFIYII